MKVTFTESALGEQHTSELMVLLNEQRIMAKNINPSGLEKILDII